jgi:predicted ATPase
MKISTLILNNIRSYEGDTRFDFSPTINLLVGPNNSGKSTVIWALNLLQTEDSNWKSPTNEAALRIGADISAIEYAFDTFTGDFIASLKATTGSGVQRGIRIELSKGNLTKIYTVDLYSKKTGQMGPPLVVFRQTEPDNLFYLFLSRRKSATYQEGVTRSAQTNVSPTLAFLAAKVDRLTSGSKSNKEKYEQYLDRVLGYQLATKASVNGKSAGMFVGDEEDFIRIENMGEGTANVAALLADLVIAKNRVFLIEELENDIHPAALKPLLEIISECSAQNQFIISTHSHIVLSRLAGTSKAKVFNFRRDQSKTIPTTRAAVLDDSPAARLQLMQELGYEMVDFGHWDGVLVLEEASAESIIRDILVPHFTPRLVSRLRTISTAGVSRVELTYDALHSTYLYLHLSPVYQNKSWVRIDAGEESAAILNKLSKKYKVTDEFKFKSYSQTNFENFYPSRFADAARIALSHADEKKKREEKRQLCRTVLDWALQNSEAAKEEFMKSAAEVIEDLKQIECAMLPS